MRFNISKLIRVLFAVVLFFNFLFWQYILFYGAWCPHCEKVKQYIKKNGLDKIVKEVEVYFSQTWSKYFLETIKDLWLDFKDVGVPFLYIDENWKKYYIEWDEGIINFLKTHKEDLKSGISQVCWIYKNQSDSCKSVVSDDKNVKTDVAKNFWEVLLIMIPAAFADSINPCAFAVMGILLGSILMRFRSKIKVIISGLLFVLAVYISYFLMGLGIVKVLTSTLSVEILKYIVWILWILVWLANLKDSIWYGRGFVMEVPFSWRPYLKKILHKIVSPMWAFFIGFIVSLFLLPCSSWPYFTFLGFLSTNWLDFERYKYLYSIYLAIYNFIFVLPMVWITFLVAFGVVWRQEVLQKKEKYVKLIHLIVGLIMIGLGIYVLVSF